MGRVAQYCYGHHGDSQFPVVFGNSAPLRLGVGNLPDQPCWCSSSQLATEGGSSSADERGRSEVYRIRWHPQGEINCARLVPEFALADRLLFLPSGAQVINNLAALRKAVDEDKELSSALPTKPRRKLVQADLANVHKAAYSLWDDIYQPHSDKLIKILGHSHPDLPVFILEGEYGPLFSPPHTFRPSEKEPDWEVGRLRTSLVAIAALRAQGGVGPQVTSHVWGLMKAESSVQSGSENERGLRWLTSEEGALWVVEAVNGLSQVVEGSETREDGRESKL